MDLALQTIESYKELVQMARAAEELGLTCFALPDHYLSNGEGLPDALAMLGGLARETSRLELGVLVSPITFRHPAVLAKMAATIDWMSSGRFALGMGAGWMEEEHDALGIPFPPLRERFERLEEGLRYVRTALGKDRGPWVGRFCALDLEKVHPLPVGPLPLIVGGTGDRRTPWLAGTYADEYNSLAVSPPRLARRIELAREAAAAAGRDPLALRLSVTGPALLGRDDHTYRRRLEAVAASSRIMQDNLERNLRSRGLPVGTPGEAGEALTAWTELGIGRFYMQPFRAIKRETLEEIVEIVT